MRGKGGGMRLAHAPQDIGLGTVVRGMEPDFALVERFTTGNHCTLTGHCRLTRVLQGGLASFRTTWTSSPWLTCWRIPCQCNPRRWHGLHPFRRARIRSCSSAPQPLRQDSCAWLRCAQPAGTHSQARDFTRKVATEACADHLSLIRYDTPACTARPQELPTRKFHHAADIAADGRHRAWRQVGVVEAQPDKGAPCALGVPEFVVEIQAAQPAHLRQHTAIELAQHRGFGGHTHRKVVGGWLPGRQFNL